MNRKMRPDAGLTMIEVVIASLILAAIVGMSSYLVWNSARTVGMAEAAMQAEAQSREFFVNLTKELHQSRMSMVNKVDWNGNLTVIPATHLKSPYPATPGTTYGITASELSTTYPKYDLKTNNPFVNTATKVYLAGVNPFWAIRFRIPGGTMDLTTLNANFEKSSSNFNLAALKANSNNPEAEFTREIQYWWEIDNTHSTVAGTAGLEGPVNGAAPGGYMPDGVDNNRDGVIDEGCIRRMETVYDKSGVVIQRNYSTPLRNVAWDTANNRPSFLFMIPSVDPAGQPQLAAGSQKRIFVALTMVKADPRDPRKAPNLTKTIHTYIDVRN